MVELDRPRLHVSPSSIKEALRVLRLNPTALYDYIYKGLSVCVENQLANAMEKIGYDEWGVFHNWQLIRSDLEFQNEIHARLCGSNYGQMSSPEAIYVIVSKLYPSVVVETGVAAGVSSAYILKAMQRNRHGYLWSIDFPNHALTEAQNVPESGFAVPAYLRDRWTLLMGKSSERLIPLLESLKTIDIFIHDSEHTHNNMLWEMEIAWMKLRDGGLIICHDINDNMAFRVFAKQVKRDYQEIFFTGIGIIRK